jgi:uncharacterized protein YyaL (SSP411 family)
MPNRLAGATSPYLQQHANNPVDWYPWSEEALERAVREDLPLLVSIGYSACHWCHVMERESFEDPDTARLMNEGFVSIKVDREERPDLDAIYMDAVQTLTGQGGWPMTVFCTPTGEPFFAGTYFPPEDRHGLPGFRKLLTAITDAWRSRRDTLAGQGRKVALALERVSRLAASPEPLTEEILSSALQTFARSYDREQGGFGAAPKFPQPMNLEFLLRCHVRGLPDALEMVTGTLRHMALGGLYDQIGGGFHRYSTDGRWLVPHFEKMLYDNAQLARLYIRAWQVSGDELFRRVGVETLDYMLSEMRHPDGGFYSAQDADSEGVEGRFFVWRYEELAGLAGEDVAGYYGATQAGNWEGVNVLWVPDPGSPVAAEAAALRGRLLKARAARIRPATDDKVLVAWNGLAIAALAEAGRVLSEPRYTEAAVEAAGFVLTRMRKPGGRLLRSWREGRTSGPAYQDDYALMAGGCLALFEATFDTHWILEAKGLAGDMIRLFHDGERGGFFQSGSDAEELVVRGKELYDNAVPSGNSAAADVLQRLGLLTGDAELERIAVSCLRLVRDLMVNAPSGFGLALSGLDLYLASAKEVAIVGDPEDERTQELVAEYWRRYLPNAVLAVGGAGDEGAAEAVPLLAGRTQLDGRPAAYVCERFSCLRPVSNPAELAALLDA